MAAERPEHPRLGRFQFALAPNLARWVATCAFLTVALPGVLLVENALKKTPDWPWAVKVAGVALVIFGLPTWWVFFRFIRYRLEIYDLGLRERRLRKRELLWDDAVSFWKEVAENRIVSSGVLRCRIMSRNGDQFVFDVGMVGFSGFCTLVERELGRRGIQPQTHVLRPRSL